MPTGRALHPSPSDPRSNDTVPRGVPNATGATVAVSVIGTPAARGTEPEDAPRNIRFDGVTARLAEGNVTIDGRIGLTGYTPSDYSLPANVVFGPTGVPSGNYDLADFAWVTLPDPAGFVPTWECGGLSNYLNYCNRKATALLQASNSQLDPRKRTADFQQADALIANDVPTVPMYQRPNPLVYKTDVKGMLNNPSSTGFAWNAEAWGWKS